MENGSARTIVITGAGSGIGRELALQAAGPGDVVWLVGRNSLDLHGAADAVRSRGAQARPVVLDLADMDASAEFLERNFPASARVDEVYLVAAITQFGEVNNLLPEDWDLIYRTNLLSPVQWITHFYRIMVDSRGGRILVVSSLAAYAGYPTSAAYAATKASLLGLYRSLVHEGRDYGVRFVIASPGYVDSAIYRKAIYRATTLEKTIREIKILGFPMLTCEQAAATILEKMNKGRSEFAFPAYAAVLKWIAPRFPLVVSAIHRKMIRIYRAQS